MHLQDMIASMTPEERQETARLLQRYGVSGNASRVIEVTPHHLSTPSGMEVEGCACSGCVLWVVDGTASRCGAAPEILWRDTLSVTGFPKACPLLCGPVRVQRKDVVL